MTNLPHFKTYLDAKPYFKLTKIEREIAVSRGTIEQFASGRRAGMGEKEGEIIAFFRTNLGYDPDRQYSQFV